MTAAKMNFYLMEQPVVPVFGLFAAKYTAFCRKTQCNMPLNAVRFGAKCKVKCCKTQGKMVLNALQSAAKCEPKSIKIHCNGINITFASHETHG